MIKFLWFIVLILGVKTFGNETFSFVHMGFCQIELHAKESAKHKPHLKSYLSQNVFVNFLMTDSTDANAMC